MASEPLAPNAVRVTKEHSGDSALSWGMDKRIPAVIVAIAAMQAGPLADFHISQPTDCKCADQHIGPVPRVAPEQPENLPQVSAVVEVRVASAGAAGGGAIGTDGARASDRATVTQTRS
jgi:hypothetical protein